MDKVFLSENQKSMVNSLEKEVKNAGNYRNIEEYFNKLAQSIPNNYELGLILREIFNKNQKTMLNG